MKDRILIFGKGFIGNRIQEAFGCDISEKKIHSFKDTEEELEKYKPKIIINCIGHTGKTNVDDCERDKDKTLFSNTFVPILLAEVAIRNKLKLVHISSGCIYHFDYSKDKPIKEERIPDFFDIYYARSKIYAERPLETLSHKSNILIARIRIPLDDRPHPRNILTKLINYKKAIDLPNSVAYIPDFIKALKHLINVDAKGIYNLTNKGGLVYAELLDIYKRYVPGFEYEVIKYSVLEQQKIIRSNLILSTSKLEKTGFKIRHINEALEECVKNYLKY